MRPKTVVIMQPQFFPWRGLFEQIRLADEFVHLDDAQFQKGGFTNRVQLRTASGPLWLTVPVARGGALPPINETEIDYRLDWRAKHVRTMRMNYARAPFMSSALDLLAGVYSNRPRTIGELDIDSIEACSAYLKLDRLFSRASQTPASAAKTERVVGLLAARAAGVYVTGRGGLDYLDAAAFEAAHIDLAVMEYDRLPYRQIHGDFEPHVSILDTIANLGEEAAATLTSRALPWLAALDRRQAAV